MTKAARRAARRHRSPKAELRPPRSAPAPVAPTDPRVAALNKLFGDALPANPLTRSQSIRALAKPERAGKAQELLAELGFAAALRVGDKTLFDLVQRELYQAAGISKDALREAVERFRARFAPPKSEASEKVGERVREPIPYEATPEGIIWHKETRDGVVTVSLCTTESRCSAPSSSKDPCTVRLDASRYLPFDSGRWTGLSNTWERAR